MLGRDRRDYWLVEDCSNKHICHKTCVLLLVLSPLQFGARDPGLSCLGSGERTDSVARSLDWPKSRRCNPTNATGDDRPDETTDSEIATLQPGETDPSPESMLTDTTRDPGTSSTRPPEWCQTESFSFGLPTPLDSRPPPLLRTQPGAYFPSPQQADLTADLMDTVARLRNEVYVLKLAPPVPLTPATWTPPARPRPAAFTTTKVPKFSGSTSWDQYS